jgi:Cu2+-exporting ATPase
MKVRTHVNAGEYATVGAAPTDDGRWIGSLRNGDWPAQLGQSVRREVAPWFTTHHPESQADDAAQTPTTSVSFAALDAASQAFARRWVDPLFGDQRDRYRQGWAGEPAAVETTPAEQTINRYVLASVGTVAAALTGSWLAAPLLPVAVAGALYTAWPIYTEAYSDLTQKRGIKSAFTYGLAITGAWLSGQFVAGALAGGLYHLAQKLLYKTKDRARHTLTDVFGQQPHLVRLVVGDGEVEVPLERVQVGDTVAVQAGEAMPVDGTVVRGIASLDQHILTGEARPVEKSAGDAVLATTTVLTGSITVRADKTGAATAAAQIAHALNQTSGYQLSIESRAQSVADGLALPSLLLSGIAWPTVGVRGAIAILTANLGWNVNLTSPLAMLTYLNRISQNGALIKDGRSLELLHTIDTIVLDKTSALILEAPRVAQIHARNGLSEDEVLALAASVEQRRSHPAAGAILAAARERGLPVAPLENAEPQAGFGLKGQSGGQVIRAGSGRFMDMEGVAVPADLRALEQTCGERGHSLVMVAADARLVGALELHVTLRPEARQVIELLRQRNKTVYILSDDQEDLTRRLAHALGIDHYIAGVQPEGKAAVIEQLQAEGKSVCFVGDGVNDAVALSKAHVSVSLRGAATVAVDAAQIVLMDQSLNRLDDLFDLADEFHTNLQVGIGWAVVPDAILIGGVFLAHMGIYAALALDILALVGGVGTAMWPRLRYPNVAGMDLGQQAPGSQAPTEAAASELIASGS